MVARCTNDPASCKMPESDCGCMYHGVRQVKITEYLIDYKDEWYIAHMAVAQTDVVSGKVQHAEPGVHRAWWAERDGSLICMCGEEYRSIDLREV